MMGEKGSWADKNLSKDYIEGPKFSSYEALSSWESNNKRPHIRKSIDGEYLVFFTDGQSHPSPSPKPMVSPSITPVLKENSIRLTNSTSSNKVPYNDAHPDVVECLQSQDKTSKLAPTDEAQKDSKPNHSAISIDDTNEKHITQNMAASYDRRALIKEIAERQKEKEIFDKFWINEINKHTPKPKPKPKRIAVRYEAFRHKKQMVFHLSTCRWLDNAGTGQTIKFKGREDAISKGFRPCTNCRP